MLNRFGLLGFVLSLGLFALATTARVTETQTGKANSVAIEQAQSVGRTVLVFVDSLARETATNPTIMPTLGRLARQGVSFDVEPCRDQLTYLCIRAALTGHDDSSLLAVSDNFRPEREGPPESLMSALSAKRRGVAVIGSSDFHPYRHWLTSEQSLAKHDEKPARVSQLLREALQTRAQLIVVALGNGDMTAHAHGTHSREYAQAFRGIDDTVNGITQIVGPSANLVVFGDHGHDSAGRHLPGTDAKTWAVYVGPAFRAGVRASLGITDHRALLGTLLGVPTEATYRGPPLSEVFDQAWSGTTFPRGLPSLESPTSGAHSASSSRALPATMVALFAILGAAFFAHARVRRWVMSGSAVAIILAAAVGLFYDRIRNIVHDHGDSPERALWLLVPVALGAVLALVKGLSPWRSERSRWSTVRATAAGTLVVVYALMLPTAYYYGSRRGVIWASAIGLLVILIERMFRREFNWQSRLNTGLVLVFTISVLLNFYSVRQLGPETGGASTWALDAPLYTQSTWVALIAAKLALYSVFVAPRAKDHSSDSALAAGLLSTSVLVEFAGAQLPRESYLALCVALVIGAFAARRQCASSLFAGALLLLDHLYGGNVAKLAPIELLLAALAVLLHWQRFAVDAPVSKWLSGLSITVAAYLMLWPTVGFHLAGLDFAFMFQWIPEVDYDKSWQWIAFGVVLKVGLPIALVVTVAREQLKDFIVRNIFVVSIAVKVAILAIVISCFSIHHSMASQQATAMLSELVLVLFSASVALITIPSHGSPVALVTSAPRKTVVPASLAPQP